MPAVKQRAPRSRRWIAPAEPIRLGGEMTRMRLRHRGPSGLIVALAALLAAGPAAADLIQDRARAVLIGAADALCPEAVIDPAAAEDALAGPLDGLALIGVDDAGPPGKWASRRLRFEDRDAHLALVMTATRAGDALRRVVLEVHETGADRPLMMALADGACGIRQGRALRYEPTGAAAELVQVGPDLRTVDAREPLNPPVPPGQDPGGVTVAQVDSGVNYLLPEIAARLARDAAGRILGYDFWDQDDRPFDGDTGRSPFFPIRHGTPVASLLLAEAPRVRLIPYRYPRPDMRRMADVVAAAAAGGAAIVALPMGSTSRVEWEDFARAAAAHPELLFVVSAGDDGRNIDETPLYPASLPLENMIVVASADAFGRLAPGANWGPAGVDLMVPAERVEVIDFRGARGVSSGSSFAVPRVAALAARLKAAHPDWRTEELKRAVLARAVPPLERGAARVAVGWIPNPAEDY